MPAAKTVAGMCGIGILILIVLALCGEGSIRDQYYLIRLASDDDAVSLAAVRYFGERRLTWAIPRIAQVYGSKGHKHSGDWWMGVAFYLVAMGEKGVPEITRMLVHDNPSVRSLAAGVLRELKAFALPAVPALIAALDDAGLSVRIAAAGALADVTEAGGGGHAGVVRALVEALKSESDAGAIPYIARSIGRLCPGATAILSHLEQGGRLTEERLVALSGTIEDCVHEDPDEKPARGS